MADDARREPAGAPPGPAVPDLDFFTQPSVVPPGPPSQQGAVPAQSRFGGQPTNQFGAPVNQFGSPTGYAPVAPPAPAKRGMGAGMTGLVAGVVLVALVAVVLGGRLAWQQFGADPVLPDTVAGMPRIGGGGVDDALQKAQAGMGDELVAGSTARVGLYTDSTSTFYVVFALRGAARSSEDEAMTEGWTESKHGKVSCLTAPPEAGETANATLCGRSFWRRAVFVMALGATADTLAVAKATDEVWRAQ